MLAFRLISGILRGTIGAKNIECVLRTGSTMIPAGEYMLLPAVQDPLFGNVVELVPAVKQGRSNTLRAKAVAQDKEVHPSAGHIVKAETVHVVGQPTLNPMGSFVLSAKAIPGRHSMVVDRGFSDLVEALQNGPIGLTVS